MFRRIRAYGIWRFRAGLMVWGTSRQARAYLLRQKKYESRHQTTNEWFGAQVSTTAPKGGIKQRAPTFQQHGRMKVLSFEARFWSLRIFRRQHVRKALPPSRTLQRTSADPASERRRREFEELTRSLPNSKTLLPRSCTAKTP